MPGHNSQRRFTALILPKLIALFCELFVCNCVLYYCHRVTTQLHLTKTCIYIYIYTFIILGQQRNQYSLITKY